MERTTRLDTAGIARFAARMSRTARLRTLLVAVLAAGAAACCSAVSGAAAFADGAAGLGSEPRFPIPRIPYDPCRYICYRATEAPLIDGALDDPSWQAAPWTEGFVDIEGGLKPPPHLATRAKMLWDDACFYVAAEMEEPDLWATFRERDAVIYHENDFEVFIDPDGDTHLYYELEINALGTVWDLLLVRPYRDGGPAVDAWDIAGLLSAVHLEGTLNDPRDRDRGWTVEIAFPWTVLAECAGVAAPPRDGDLWRVNFSRVQWDLDTSAGAGDERAAMEDAVTGEIGIIGTGGAPSYVKRSDPATGKPLPEHNWVWSPQGLIAMHYPEMWGVVQFSTLAAGKGAAVFVPEPDEQARWTLRQIYYAQKERAERGAPLLTDRKRLRATLGVPVPEGLRLEVGRTRFEASLPATAGGWLTIDETGRLVPSRVR